MRFLLLSSLVLTACSFQLGSSTNGDSGRAQFEYDACFFGCKVDQPMMLGTTELIRVGGAVPPVSVRSTDDSVFSVSESSRDCCPKSGPCRTLTPSDACAAGESTSLSVFVVATGAGDAQLVLDQGNGKIFDSVSLAVAQPKSLVVSCGEDVASTALAPDNACLLGWTARDSSGNALMASTGVVVTTSDPSVADLRATILSSGAPSITALQGMLGSSLVAHSAGETTITASASGATSKLVAIVTP